jgi:tripartite-type tricarboxylate transporter receptor subunit TctC
MTRILLALLALSFSFPAAAQAPDRPVTMLAGYPPGGLVDVVSRLVAEGMKAKYPAGLNVVNRPGAAGALAVAEVVRAKPDGTTIVLTPQSALVIAAQMQELAYKTPDDYDPRRRSPGSCAWARRARAPAAI